MKFIKLTLTNTSNNTVIEYFINCDKIWSISKYGNATWVSYGNPEGDVQVDQTPEEILELIQGGNK